MGAGSSISITNKEVSFVNEKTGKLLPENEIMNISNQVCKEFDYKPSYYDAYKVDKHGNNPYELYARHLSKKLIK